MLSKHFACLILLTGGLCTMTISVPAQDADGRQQMPLAKTIGRVTPTGPVPSLAVLNAAGAKLEGNKLTLTGVSPNSIVFADRPVRAAGHVMTQQFIMQWDEGKDSFSKDPPNATVSVLGGDGSKVIDAVVTLKSPKLEGGNLTFDVAVLEGNLAGASGPAALFIDYFAGDFDRAGDYRGARSAYWHAPVYHGAWYGRSGVSNASAAYNSYVIPNQCGYYPYSPCGNE
ncbi:hypothetical protein [Microvirga calopogonii]|uniref:hypothetical protein n=1 Tax=Microvirga calopogonii TaxID=2078013 RepID=UPI000E0D8EB1|nr:hypothetical protein [Microvirga calopogonii]